MSQAELPRQAVSLPGLSVSRRAGSGLTAALRLWKDRPDLRNAETQKSAFCELHLICDKW